MNHVLLIVSLIIVHYLVMKSLNYCCQWPDLLQHIFLCIINYDGTFVHVICIKFNIVFKMNHG